MRTTRQFPDDEQLVKSYKSGDQDSFSILFEKNSKLVKYYCWREVSRFRNSEDIADDIAQSVWMDLSVYLNKFNEDCSFHTMVKIITKNRAINWIRDNKQELEMYNNENILEEIPDPGSPDQDLLVNDMLKSLEPEKKALVIAMVFEGHTGEEDDLAGKLGVARSTVSRRLDRAFEKLRGEINKNYTQETQEKPR